MKAPAGLAASLPAVAPALVAIVPGASAVGAEPGLPTNLDLPPHVVAYGYDAPVEVALGRTVKPAVSEVRSFTSERAATAPERPAGDNYDVGRSRVAPTSALDDFASWGDELSDRARMADQPLATSVAHIAADWLGPNARSIANSAGDRITLRMEPGGYGSTSAGRIRTQALKRMLQNL